MVSRRIVPVTDEVGNARDRRSWSGEVLGRGPETEYHFSWTLTLKVKSGTSRLHAMAWRIMGSA
jgi:hypothetical protein